MPMANIPWKQIWYNVLNELMFENEWVGFWELPALTEIETFDLPESSQEQGMRK